MRHTLYGPDGVWPFERFIEAVTFVNVFRLSPSPIYWADGYAQIGETNRQFARRGFPLEVR